MKRDASATRQGAGVSDYVVGEKGVGASVGTVGLKSVKFASLPLDSGVNLSLIHI